MIDSHGHFVWYELMTTDMAAAKTFYAKVMGWRVHDASTPDMAYALFSAGEAFVTGIMDLAADARKLGEKPRWIGYVGANDVDATAERVRRLGGAVHSPPKDILDISRFSVVADPQIATFGLLKWLRPGQQSAGSGKPGHVSWHELFANDWEKAFAFYAELFSWRKVDADIGPMGTYQLFAAGEQTMGGMFTKPETVPVPFWLYYFSVRDIDAAAARVKAGGGQILEGPLEMPGGDFIARCVDPQGAMFALEGARSSNPIGYFKRAAPGEPSGARGRRFIGG
jgi:predicted enzyme related to lactoylglutathione lyase